MDKRFSLSHTVAYTPPWECPPSSAIFLKKKYSIRHTNTITTAYYYTPVFNNIGLKGGSLSPYANYAVVTNSLQKRSCEELSQTGFRQYRSEKGQSEPYATYALLTNSQQKRAAKNYLRQVFSNIGLKGGSLSPSVLAKNEGTEVFRLVSATRRGQRERAPFSDLYCTENRIYDLSQLLLQAKSARACPTFRPILLRKPLKTFNSSQLHHHTNDSKPYAHFPYPFLPAPCSCRFPCTGCNGYGTYSPREGWREKEYFLPE